MCTWSLCLICCFSQLSSNINQHELEDKYHPYKLLPENITLASHNQHSHYYYYALLTLVVTW